MFQSPRLYLLPLLMALAGMGIATLAANAGQRAVREQDFRQLAAKFQVLQAQYAATVDPAAREALAAQLRHLEPTLANISSYHRPGRVFTNWDGYRYEEIIEDGYVYNASDSSTITDATSGETRLKNVAWYPLYPLLGYGVKTLTGVPTHYALTVVSWLCIGVGAVVFLALAREHFAGRMAVPEKGAFWAVAFLLYGPASIFLYANFTESLFVVLLASFLYCLQGRRWWVAAVIAAAASATRSQGVLFGPVLAVVYLYRSEHKDWGFKLGTALGLGVVSAVGLGCYMMFLQGKFGDPLAFMHVQKNWAVGINAKTLGFAVNPVNAVTNFLDYLGRPVWDLPRIWESFCVIAPPILLLAGGRRWLSAEMNLLGWILWGLPYVSNSLAGSYLDPSVFAKDEHWMSMGRFVAVILPLQMIVGGGVARRRWVGGVLLALSAAAFALLAYKFGMGKWIG